MAHLKKFWYLYAFAALALIYVIISTTKKQWNPMNWFALGATARANVQKCCHAHNPCGWSSATYKKFCSAAP